MLKHNQVGAISGVVISLVFAILLLLASLGFGVWAFGGRQDYKNNVDAKINTAVANAKHQQNAADQAQFAQDAKKPLKAYDGPQAYGSLVVNFPKTWSAYVDDAGTGTSLVDGYFAPGSVPSISNRDSVFALRVQVIGQAYAQTLSSFSSQQQAGQLSISAYSLPQLPKIVGVKAVGQLPGSQGQASGTMIVLPLRSQTLEIWTEGTQYLDDFNNNILPNFTFSP
jgi:hypothetical protein